MFGHIIFDFMRRYNVVFCNTYLWRLAPLGFGIWKRCQSVMKKFRLNFAGLSSIEGVEEIYIFVCIIIDAKFAYLSG